MNILVVEDEPKAGNYLLNGLQELGYSVSLARNGADARARTQIASFVESVLERQRAAGTAWSIESSVAQTTGLRPPLGGGLAGPGSAGYIMHNYEFKTVPQLT